MQVFNQGLVDKALSFLKGITKDDRVAVIHHTDPDGVSSGVLMCKLIERLRGKPVDLRHNQPGTVHGFMTETLELLKTEKINKVVTTDITSEENYPNWKDIEEFAKILIVDHHPIRYEETDCTIIIKPQLFQKEIIPSKYCASKLVYDLGMRVVDMSDLDWVASIGVISDITSDCWDSFLQEVFKKYNFIKGKSWFDSTIGRVASVMSSTECYDENLVYQVFGIVYRAKEPQDILNSELKKYKEIISKEVEYWISNLEKKAEIYPEIEAIYYEIAPKYHVKSSISTVLGVEKPNKTIFVISKENNKALISARRGDYKKDMGAVLRRAIEGIPNSNAGGHPPAAGAIVPLEHYEKFKKKLFEILKNG
ncbi:DHH family phosphoesterase [Candidatus Woesearchaeota archaeon]|nr:DHH family phosphoesterase [Candidatus Woesearchaeota archaeon]